MQTSAEEGFAMSRAAWLRRAAGCVLFPTAAILAAECGGNDVIESTDASTDASFDDSAFARSDAMVTDGSGDEGGVSSDGSSSPDAEADGPDAATDGDATSLDADAASPEVADGRGGDAALEGGGLVGPPLRSASAFAVLAGSTITNTGITTSITGDVGIYPGTALVALTTGEINGNTHLGDAVAMQAQADLAVAYGNLVARPCGHDMTNVDLGGKTLAPGVYCFAVAATQAVGNLTLDSQGDPNAVWIFQIASTLTISANVSTTVINGGSGCNVYWQVGSSATINVGAQLVGNVLASASITLLTGANVTPGRTLAQSGAVTLDTNVISKAGCQ
jgi:Ice-binding-like